MTDIVERLRKPPFEMWETTERKVCEDAADEIERLRIRERELLHWLQQVQLKAEFAKQKAIVARDAADHAIQYAIDAETAAIAAITTSQRAEK